MGALSCLARLMLGIASHSVTEQLPRLLDFFDPQPEYFDF